MVLWISIPCCVL